MHKLVAILENLEIRKIWPNIVHFIVEYIVLIDWCLLASLKVRIYFPHISSLFSQMDSLML